MGNVPLLSGFFQMGYVTGDLDAAVRQLGASNGIERFRIKRNVRGMPGMPEMLMHQAHVFIGSVQLEVIQPAGGDDGLYRGLCAADGRAIRLHHLGMWVDCADVYAGLRSALEGQGIPVVLDAVIPSVGGAIYADARPMLGHYLEYVHLVPEAKDRYYADVPRY